MLLLLATMKRGSLRAKRRAMRLRLALPCALSVLALAACGESQTANEEQASAPAVEAESAVPEEGTVTEVTQANGATPMAERVATIGLLNKRNNVSRDFEISPGDMIEDGPVIVRLSACERTAPHEFPQETGAFVQVDVLERGESEHTRIFSGWLFKENPSLNIVEHPVYDVWVKDCTMSFPGEE